MVILYQIQTDKTTAFSPKIYIIYCSISTILTNAAPPHGYTGEGEGEGEGITGDGEGPEGSQR